MDTNWLRKNKSNIKLVWTQMGYYEFIIILRIVTNWQKIVILWWCSNKIEWTEMLTYLLLNFSLIFCFNIFPGIKINTGNTYALQAAANSISDCLLTQYLSWILAIWNHFIHFFPLKITVFWFKVIDSMTASVSCG